MKSLGLITTPFGANAKELDFQKITHLLYALGYHETGYYKWYLRIVPIRILYGYLKIEPKVKNFIRGILIERSNKIYKKGG